MGKRLKGCTARTQCAEDKSAVRKTCAQSEPAISILPARARAISGPRANGLTQKNAWLRPYPALQGLFSPKRCGLNSMSVIGRDSFELESCPFNRDFLSPRLRSETLRQEPHPPNVNTASDYCFSAGLPFNSTRTRSIGPFPTFSGRCAPAFSHIVWPALPAPSSLLPSG